MRTLPGHSSAAADFAPGFGFLLPHLVSKIGSDGATEDALWLINPNTGAKTNLVAKASLGPNYGGRYVGGGRMLWTPMFGSNGPLVYYLEDLGTGRITSYRVATRDLVQLAGAKVQGGLLYTSLDVGTTCTETTLSARDLATGSVSALMEAKTCHDVSTAKAAPEPQRTRGPLPLRLQHAAIDGWALSGHTLYLVLVGTTPGLGSASTLASLDLRTGAVKSLLRSPGYFGSLVADSQVVAFTEITGTLHLVYVLRKGNQRLVVLGDGSGVTVSGPLVTYQPDAAPGGLVYDAATGAVYRLLPKTGFPSLFDGYLAWTSANGFSYARIDPSLLQGTAVAKD
ncbi:MAG: hypothetical protein M0Z66_05775 [Thermaerobacter sp.]|nr:hypothetical protein [Thermaerobacter sp.]